MAEGAVGRKLLLKKNSTVLAGLRNVTVSKGDTSINVTSGENDGIQCLFSESAEQMITITFDGIEKDNILKNIAFDTTADKMLDDIEIEFPIFVNGNTTPATITGNFRLGPFELGSPYNDAITFSSTLDSSGDWVYTPEAA